MPFIIQTLFHPQSPFLFYLPGIMVDYRLTLVLIRSVFESWLKMIGKQDLTLMNVKLTGEGQRG